MEEVSRKELVALVRSMNRVISDLRKHKQFVEKSNGKLRTMLKQKSKEMHETKLAMEKLGKLIKDNHI